MPKTYLVTKQYYYLGVGTILKEVSPGAGYYVWMPENNVVKCGISFNPVVHSGVVEKDTEHFEDITDEFVGDVVQQKQQVYEIPTPKPDKWPGSLVVSKYKVSTIYGSIPVGTIFQLDNRPMTVNKYMQSIPCVCCRVSFKSMFKGSREAFLKSFYFVSRSEVSDKPLTQIVFLETGKAGINE